MKKWSERKLIAGVKYNLKDVRFGMTEPSTNACMTVGDMLCLLMHPQIKVNDTLHIREGATHILIKEGKVILS